MTDIEISKIIHKEFKEKSLLVTSQYLEIHSPIYESEQIRIERIDRDKTNNKVIAYLPVKDEYFFFAVFIDNKTGEILEIDTESRNLVSVVFVSEILNSTQLKSLTKLKCQECWNKGDKIPHKKAFYKHSGIVFYANPEPDGFEDKLEKLLNFLESDKEGILLASTKAKGYIHVSMDFHRGNQLLGSFKMECEIVKRISTLNLEINFRITAWGNNFK